MCFFIFSGLLAAAYSYYWIGIVSAVRILFSAAVIRLSLCGLKTERGDFKLLNAALIVVSVAISIYAPVIYAVLLIVILGLWMFNFKPSLSMF